MTIGARIKKFRELRKLTQAQLARLIGITQPSMSEIETGETRELMAETLLRISAALKVNPFHLFSGKGPIEMRYVVDSQEAETVVLCRLLTEVNREHWLSIGKSLLDTQPPSPDQAEGPQHSTRQ